MRGGAAAGTVAAMHKAIVHALGHQVSDHGHIALRKVIHQAYIKRHCTTQAM